MAYQYMNDKDGNLRQDIIIQLPCGATWVSTIPEHEKDWALYQDWVNVGGIPVPAAN